MDDPRAAAEAWLRAAPVPEGAGVYWRLRFWARVVNVADERYREAEAERAAERLRLPRL